VRQPVAEVLVKARTPQEADSLRKNASLVLEELNARTLTLLEDETVVVSYDVKPNLPVLGKKYGAEVASIRAALGALAPMEVAEAVRRGRNVTVAGKELEPEDILLKAQDVEGFAAAQDVGYTVAVTTAITPELADEGLARELVRRLQDMRREAGFALSDRITTWINGDAEVARVLAAHGDYICNETLTTELLQSPPPPEADSLEVDLEGTKARLGVRKT
jgi:isoleucyl-tRNA synthetase